MCECVKAAGPKDTPLEQVKQVTYRPVLSTFEREVELSLGVVEHRKRAPTFWY